MNGKRFPRALLLAVITASVGLFWCMAVFFLLWGNTLGAKLLPFMLFTAALLLSLPVFWLVERKK